jgi:hypothetical protein
MFATMAYYSSKIAASAYMDRATPHIRLLYIIGTHMISLLVRTSFVAIAIGAPAAYAQDVAEPIIVVTGTGLTQPTSDPA